MHLDNLNGIYLADATLQPISNQDFLFPGSIWSLESWDYVKSGNKVTYTMKIKRNPEYTLYNIIIPCVLLSIMQVSVFGIRADCLERSAFALTVLLAFSIYQVMVSQDLPGTNDLVYLVLYVSIQFTIGTVVLVFSAILCYLIRKYELTRMDKIDYDNDHIPDIPLHYSLADKIGFIILLTASLASHIVSFAMITSLISF